MPWINTREAYPDEWREILVKFFIKNDPANYFYIIGKRVGNHIELHRNNTIEDGKREIPVIPKDDTVYWVRMEDIEFYIDPEEYHKRLRQQAKQK